MPRCRIYKADLWNLALALFIVYLFFPCCVTDCAQAYRVAHQTQNTTGE